MSKSRKVLLPVALALGLLTGCGEGEAPPGRWEGFAETAKWLVAVRLQVDPGNVIHATALSVSVDGVSLPRRLELRDRIRAELLEQWPNAVEGKVDFKDGVLTKAGGYAPLFVHDGKSNAMMFQFYAGGRLTERVRLYPVPKFTGANG